MITGLSIRSNVPVDDRLVYDVTPDTVMLPEYRRYEGMVIYVKDAKMLKVLQADLLTWSELPLDGRAGFMSFEKEDDYKEAWNNKTNVYWEAKSMFVPGTLVFLTEDKKLMMIDDAMELQYLAGGDSADNIDMTHKLNITRFERFLGTRRIKEELPGTYKILEDDMEDTPTMLNVVSDADAATVPNSVGITEVRIYNQDAIIGDRVEWVLGTVPVADPTGFYKIIEDLEYDDKLHPRKPAIEYDHGGIFAGTPLDPDVKIREILNGILFPYKYPTLTASGDIGILDLTDDAKTSYNVTVTVPDYGECTEISNVRIYDTSGTQVLANKVEQPRIDDANDTGIMRFTAAEVKKDTGGVAYQLRLVGSMPAAAMQFDNRGYMATTDIMFKFVYPSFFGISNTAGIDDVAVVAGTKSVQDYNEDFSFTLTTANEFDFFAVPNDVIVEKILDQNSLDITDSYITSTVQITFGALAPKEYTVYRTELRQTVADFTKTVVVKK